MEIPIIVKSTKPNETKLSEAIASFEDAAIRLKECAINVIVSLDNVHWFDTRILEEKDNRLVDVKNEGE